MSIERLAARVEAAESTDDWSFILGDYIKWGNYKIHRSVGIFNIGSAHDCVNRGTERCQVGADECYAVISEKKFADQLRYNRRQEFLWDCLDAETFADAFLAHVDRKRTPVTALRFNETGDVRHQPDVDKLDHIAEILKESDISVYTYSSSSHLDWSGVDHLVVNRSDPDVEYGDRQFLVVESTEDIPDGFVHCPFDRNQEIGGTTYPKCGQCRLCIDADGPDVAVVQHYGNQF